MSRDSFEYLTRVIGFHNRETWDSPEKIITSARKLDYNMHMVISLEKYSPRVLILTSQNMLFHSLQKLPCDVCPVWNPNS